MLGVCRALHSNTASMEPSVTGAGEKGLPEARARLIEHGLSCPMEGHDTFAERPKVNGNPRC